MSHAHPVVHFENLGRDKKLLEEFYSAVFHWEIEPIQEDYSLAKPGSGIGGGIGAMGEGRRHVIFYVAVEDVGEALKLVESIGGKKAFGPHPIPDGGIIAGFLDPEGNLIDRPGIAGNVTIRGISSFPPRRRRAPDGHAQAVSTLQEAAQEAVRRR